MLSLLLLCASQAWTFPGFQIYEAEDLNGLVTDACATALSQTIHCSPYFMQYQSPRVGQSTGDSALTDMLCDPSCGVSLQSWFDNVASNCADQFLGDADPTLLGGYVWQGYNETCLKDPSTGEYCTGKTSLSVPQTLLWLLKTLVLAKCTRRRREIEHCRQHETMDACRTVLLVLDTYDVDEAGQLLLYIQ